MLALIEATSETGEGRYLDRALDLAQSWLEANPREDPASDFSWNDHSTALRAQVLVCLANAAPGHEWLEDGLELHGTTLADPAFYVNRGNHALNQDIGLLEVGCYLGRDDWKQLAQERIDDLLAQSVDRQGVVNEQAIGYALYNYQRYTVAHEVLDACGLPEPAGFELVRKIPGLPRPRDRARRALSAHRRHPRRRGHGHPGHDRGLRGHAGRAWAEAGDRHQGVRCRVHLRADRLG